ncbi:MAG: hypothetical protein DMG98_19725 [Acidobacteria bacterium]|nr:MAG: hypothetical protein DMG98_19725 [Acidobacteriota bacterium]
MDKRQKRAENPRHKPFLCNSRFPGFRGAKIRYLGREVGVSSRSSDWREVADWFHAFFRSLPGLAMRFDQLIAAPGGWIPDLPIGIVALSFE